MSYLTLYSLVEYDVFPEVMCHIPFNDICCNVALVGRSFADITKSERLWMNIVSSVFEMHSLPTNGASTTWLEYFKNLYLSLDWDTNFNCSELGYPCTRFCNKISSSPNISYAIGKQGFDKGKIKWGVKVHKMHTELRIGFTINPKIKYNTHTLSCTETWIYSDGGSTTGIWNGKLLAEAKRYTKGDTVGIELDFSTKQATFYHNSEFQASVALPPGTLYPLVALDFEEDLVEFLPHNVNQNVY